MRAEQTKAEQTKAKLLSGKMTKQSVKPYEGPKQKTVTLYLPGTDIEEEVKLGWSWTGFLFGPIAQISKGLWGEAIFLVILNILLWWTIIVPVATWLYVGGTINDKYYIKLLEKGYRIKDD